MNTPIIQGLRKCNKTIQSAWMLIVLSMLLAACTYQPKQHQTPFLVVATTGMIGDAAKNILPENFTVHVLMGPGVDPHMYEAKPSDIRSLSKAETIVYNGLHLEGKMAEILMKLKREKEVLALADGLNQEALIEVDEGVHDPHIWLDPFLWAEGVKYIGKQLAGVYPAFESEILSRTERYVMQIEAQGEMMKVQFDQIPARQRVLITSHDAFNYFGKAFGIEVEALQGISTVAEPGIRKVEELTDLILKRNIPSLFVESSVSSKSIQALKQACARSDYNIRDGGTLYSDAMGDEKSGAETYLKMLKVNTETIVKGLK